MKLNLGIINTIVRKIESKSIRFYFVIGFIGTFGVTLSEVIKWKQRIYFVYNNATRDYWQHLNPYDISWAGTRAPDEYLYGPLFNFLFLPFSLMPAWLGPFMWNFFSYGVFFYAVFSLPSPFEEKIRKRIWLYMLPLLLNNLMYYQYNVLVAAFFLMVFTAMETHGMFRAAFLIAISALTKIYGGFQYMMFLLYSKPIKNGIKYGIPLFLLLLIFPIVHDGPTGLYQVYQNWIHGLSHHSQTRSWQSVFYIKLLFSTPPVNTGIYQLITGVFVFLLVLLSMRKKDELQVRTGMFAIMLGWMILFSSAPEISTYLIAMSGYLVWYFSASRKVVDQILFWLNFTLIVIVPQDVLCPKPLMRILIFDWNLNLIVFLMTWVSMIFSVAPIFLFYRSGKLAHKD